MDASMAPAVLAAVLVAVLAVYFVILPVWQSRSTILIDDNHPVADLLQRKDAALRAIRELEFDYNTGKLSTDDFDRINQRLRQQATTFLRQIEEIAPNSAGLDEELEAVIASKRRTKV